MRGTRVMTSTKVSLRMDMSQYHFLAELAAQNNRPMSEEIRAHLPKKPTIEAWLKKGEQDVRTTADMQES